jgi:hypothetical protein
MSNETYQVVLLGQKGEIKQGKLKTVSLAGIASVLKKKEEPSILGRYFWKTKTLYLFGYADGKDGHENQHHLPPPLEGITIYGDILVLASMSQTSYSKPIQLKTSEYETFYTCKLEGEDEEEEGEEVYESESESNTPEEFQNDEEEEEYADDIPSIESSEDEEEEELQIPIEKPVRVSRSRKVLHAPQVEEKELESTDTSPHPLRERVQTLLVETLVPHISKENCIALEEHIFQRSLQTCDLEEIRKVWSSIAFRDVYLAISRRILGNLNPNSYIQNKHVLTRVISGELTLEQLVKQNYYELCPEKWQQYLDAQAKREQVQLEGDFSRATDKWLCNGCKMRKCTYYELQTRSADEPMTIFIHCLNCGKRWTQ